jgi:hypothetical protein
MSSTSEKTFGSRIENARKFISHLQSFQNYQPETGDYSIADYAAAIQIAETINPFIASTKLAYRQAVAERKALYYEAPNSIKKLTSPIGSYVRAKFGKDSSNYLELNGLILKIRGTKLKTQTTADSNAHSMAQQSYGSLLFHFENAIAGLQTMGNEYNPGNQQIQLSALVELKNLAIEKNNTVATTFATLNPKQNERNQIYDTLSMKTQRIKDFVKSQYGVGSSEYKLIKGLKI